MSDETWHVALFHHHTDGTATIQAWWVDGRYASDMIAHMGAADGEAVLSVEDVEASIAASARETWLHREESP